MWKVEIKNIDNKYNFEFDFDSKDKVTIFVGENGSYKSYILNIIKSIVNMYYNEYNEFQYEKLFKQMYDSIKNKITIDMNEYNGYINTSLFSPEDKPENYHKNYTKFLEIMKNYIPNKIIDNKIEENVLSKGESKIYDIFLKCMLGTDNQIYIIDEPENSLSVEWQDRLVYDLLNTGKIDYLIIATHSPFIFGNYNSNINTDIDKNFNKNVFDMSVCLTTDIK